MGKNEVPSSKVLSKKKWGSGGTMKTFGLIEWGRDVAKRVEKRGEELLK